MWKAWQRQVRKTREAVVTVGLSWLPALVCFGPLFMTRMVGTAPDPKGYLRPVGFAMVWLAGLIVLVSVNGLVDRVEALEKKAGIRK